MKTYVSPGVSPSLFWVPRTGKSKAMRLFYLLNFLLWYTPCCVLRKMGDVFNFAFRFVSFCFLLNGEMMRRHSSVSLQGPDTISSNHSLVLSPEQVFGRAEVKATSGLKGEVIAKLRIISSSYTLFSRRNKYGWCYWALDSLLLPLCLLVESIGLSPVKAKAVEPKGERSSDFIHSLNIYWGSILLFLLFFFHFF